MYSVYNHTNIFYIFYETSRIYIYIIYYLYVCIHYIYMYTYICVSLYMNIEPVLAL